MRWLVLLAYFAWELLLSALQVALLVVQPGQKLRPGIVAYPLTLTSDLQITLLANLITLTPGTLSLEVSADRRTLFIHALDIESREALVGKIAAGFEARIMRVTRR